MSEHFKRDVNSLLSFTVNDADFEDHDDDDRDDRRDNRNGNNHNNQQRDNKNGGNHNNGDRNNPRDNQNQQRDNRNGGNQNQNNGKKGDQWNNPLCRILNEDNRVFDRDDVLNLLIKKDGLVIMIKDLKSAKKDPSNQQRASYVSKLLKDVVFASALPEALEEICGKKYDENDNIGKKELGYLMNEILVYLNSSFARNTNPYDDEVNESMRRSYTDILYRYNKKKVKKLMEEVKGMSKGNAKQIAIITSGSNPASSIYTLLKFLYRGGNAEDEMFATSSKALSKLFKVCYGKENMDNVVKCLMLEKANPNISEDAVNVSVNINDFILKYLEDLDKNEINQIIKNYIADRKRQEKNTIIPRRFGDRRTIHPDDYPKLTKTLEDIERRDFSIIQYLRK